MIGQFQNCDEEYDRDLLGCVVVFLVATIGAILVMSHLDMQRAKQSHPSTPTAKVIE